MEACDIPGIGLRVAPNEVPDPVDDLMAGEDRGEAVLAGGCFWCTEAVFRRLQGVEEVVPGYAGGAADVANYKAVCSGRTGHAEVVLAVFDPSTTSYEQMLKVFWESHNPTQGMRQGNDVGTQYRSLIAWHSDAQRRAAENSRDMFQKVLWDAGLGDITTELVEAGPFYYAEPYHQQYLAANPNGYCGLGGTGLSCPVGVASAE